MPTILTNALLNIGFSLIASFTNVVPVPSSMVPTRVDDVKAYAIGGAWPTDLDLLTKGGAQFTIQHGSVIRFKRADSFTARGDPSVIAPFRGNPTLSSNHVLELATATIRRLAKGDDPTTWALPEVRRCRESDSGPELPIYEIQWRSTGSQARWVACYVEIDARDGQIGALDVFGRPFFDLAFAWEMRKRVCIEGGAGAGAPVRSAQTKTQNGVFPRPSTNQVTAGIEKWLWLCRALELSPGPATNLASVNWDLSCTYTNARGAHVSVEAQVTFTNGTWFTVDGSTACAHFASDACYVDEWRSRQLEDWFLLEGQIAWHWDQLAEKLERRMIQRLAIPIEMLAGYTRELRNFEPRFGGREVKRVVVEWRNGDPSAEHRDGVTLVMDPHLAFAAEFDLESGETKSFWLVESKLIQALARVQP